MKTIMSANVLYLKITQTSLFSLLILVYQRTQNTVFRAYVPVQENRFVEDKELPLHTIRSKVYTHTELFFC